MNFFKKFKSKTDDKLITNDITVKDNLIFELSNRYISYILNNDTKINTVQLPIQEYENFNSLLDLWIETINVIIETLNTRANITIIIKSSKFYIKNHDKHLEKKNVNKFFANKLALDEDNLEVKQLTSKSYLIVEYKFLQKILFAFKNYRIQNIYDISLFNSFHIKSESNSLYIDLSFDSCTIVLNNEKIQKRNLKLDLGSLIQSCAKELYVDFETSYENIRLDFKDIKSYDSLKQSTKPLQKLLKEFVDKLVEDIKNTLSYFSIYENIEYLDKIYINGDILELEFIIKILSDKLDINFIPLNKYIKINKTEKTNLTIFSNTHNDTYEKLNLNFQGLNYSDGRDEYVFIENKFVSKGKLSASQKTKVTTQKKEVKINNQQSFLYDEFDKPVWKMGMGELYIFLQNRLFKNKNLGDAKFLNLNIFYVIVLLPILITSIYLFNQISDTQREFTNNINTLEDRISRVDMLKKQIIKKNKQVNIDIQKKDIDKIFWTQKFITLSNLMPNEIWLSSITMKNNIKKIEDKEVTSQIMILESRSLPSANGHISSIAMYMDKLLSANYDFKKDFSNINFGGAEIVNEYGYDVINFKLLCNFEKNINIKNIEDINKKEKNNSISDNLQNINQKSKIREELLEKL